MSGDCKFPVGFFYFQLGRRRLYPQGIVVCRICYHLPGSWFGLCVNTTEYAGRGGESGRTRVGLSRDVGVAKHRYSSWRVEECKEGQVRVLVRMLLLLQAADELHSDKRRHMRTPF